MSLGGVAGGCCPRVSLKKRVGQQTILIQTDTFPCCLGSMLQVQFKVEILNLKCNFIYL